MRICLISFSFVLLYGIHLNGQSNAQIDISPLWRALNKSNITVPPEWEKVDNITYVQIRAFFEDLNKRVYGLLRPFTEMGALQGMLNRFLNEEIKPENVSKQCLSDMDVYFGSLTQRKMWAMQSEYKSQ